MGGSYKKRIDLTTGEVSRMCGVATRTVSKWADRFGLGHYRLPHSQDRRIPRRDLIAFLRSRGMPIPPEIADEACITMGLEQRIDGWQPVTPFELGTVISTSQIAAVLFGSGLAIWLVREAATLIRQHSPKAKIGLILDEDQAGVVVHNDPTFNAGVYQQPCDVHTIAQAILIREHS